MAALTEKLSARDRYPIKSQYVGLQAEPGPEDKNAYIATGKALSYLMRMESDGSCGLERDSVYGAAVAVPQVCRSSGWSATMLALSIRSYLFLFLNVFLQTYLLTVVADSEILLSAFAGRMHLCDMGAHLKDCPDGPNCLGPTGTKITAPRLYTFDVWQTRVFVRDSLTAIFPDRAEEIANIVDPGEYGLESYNCRAVCCFIFMMSMMDDLYKTLSLAVLLWHVPTDDSKWLRYEVPQWAEKGHAKKIHNWTELHLVKFGVSGMPMRWKVANLVFVFIPKMCIWWMLASLGIHFLMETAGIVDVIMNSIALTFIINLDEMIFAVLTTVPVKHIMANMEDFDLFIIDEAEGLEDEEIYQKYMFEELGPQRWRNFFRVLLPKRLLTVLVLLVALVSSYYTQNCDRRADGSLVSKPMMLPKVVNFALWDFFTGSYPMEEDPSWAMPPA